MGLASELGLECSHCGARESQVMSERRGQALDVNRRAVLASRVVGFGREGLTKFCGLMNMPVPALSKDAFQNNQRAVLTVTVAQRSLNKAAADLRSVQEQQGCDVPGDCAVTYDSDGTWMRRGHTSLHGVTTAIAWQTGQIIDYEVFTKFKFAKLAHKIMPLMRQEKFPRKLSPSGRRSMLETVIEQRTGLLAPWKFQGLLNFGNGLRNNAISDIQHSW